MKWETVNHLIGDAELKSAWSKMIKSDLPKHDSYPCWKISLVGIVNSQLFCSRKTLRSIRKNGFFIIEWCIKHADGRLFSVLLLPSFSLVPLKLFLVVIKMH